MFDVINFVASILSQVMPITKKKEKIRHVLVTRSSLSAIMMQS